MRINEYCADCLYGKQEARVRTKPEDKRAEYLKEIKQLLDNRGEDVTSPYMVYVFDQTYKKYFHEESDYLAVKKRYNDLVLSMEKELEGLISASEDPLAASLLYARVGNYIDFGALSNVDVNCFLGLFDNIAMSTADRKVYQSFLEQCRDAETFLLIADNCGEIVLDKLFIKQLKNRFPHMKVYLLVRGGEVLNDVTEKDAVYVGIDRYAEVVSNGNNVAGTIYDMMPEKAKKIFDNADVILAKGQGNYESLFSQGFRLFYSFLCKCELFTGRFGVAPLTGMFVEEQ